MQRERRRCPGATRRALSLESSPPSRCSRVRAMSAGSVIAALVLPARRRSCASLRPRHTVHPVRRRSCASLRPRHTVHPVHKVERLEQAAPGILPPAAFVRPCTAHMRGAISQRVFEFMGRRQRLGRRALAGHPVVFAVHDDVHALAGQLRGDVAANSAATAGCCRQRNWQCRETGPQGNFSDCPVLIGMAVRRTQGRCCRKNAA